MVMSLVACLSSVGAASILGGLHATRDVSVGARTAVGSRETEGECNGGYWTPASAFKFEAWTASFVITRARQRGSYARGASVTLSFRCFVHDG